MTNEEIINEAKEYLEEKERYIPNEAIQMINALVEEIEKNNEIIGKLEAAIESNQATINAIIIAASALPQAQGFPIDEIGVSIKNHNQVLHVFFKKNQEVNGEFWRYESHKIESL